MCWTVYSAWVTDVLTSAGPVVDTSMVQSQAMCMVIFWKCPFVTVTVAVNVKRGFWCLFILAACFLLPSLSHSEKRALRGFSLQQSAGQWGWAHFQAHIGHLLRDLSLFSRLTVTTFFWATFLRKWWEFFVYFGHVLYWIYEMRLFLPYLSFSLL